MARPIRVLRFAPLFFLFAPFASGQYTPETQAAAEAQEVCNWPAPLLWKPAAPARAPGETRTEAVSTASAPLPFIAITPCRVADTRGNGFIGAYGTPALVANATRNFTITGKCGIPASAAAVSFNFAALNVGAAGDLRIFPAGGGVPPVSTLNYNANTPNIANAAVVPLGTGAITVEADAVSIDLIIDVNGYYDNSGVITGVSPGTGMTGGGTSGVVSLGIAAGGVTSTELAANAVTSSKIAANAVTAGAIASGQVAKNVNGVTDSVTVAGSGLVTVNTAGSTITVGGGGTPSGSFILGIPNDTTLIGAGYTELGPSNQDAWKTTSTVGAPTGRYQHTAVWTGTKMIVWGGYDFVSLFNTGGQYDPVVDSWTATTTNGPSARVDHTAVWTGTKMVVWGGYDSTGAVNTGGQYDPASDSWTKITTAGVPSARAYHTAVWTGTKMIVWGGYDGVSYFNTGGRYDPAVDSWTATTMTGVPSARIDHTAVWTGSKMVVWGGWDAAPTHTNTGGRYDPAVDSWTATTTAGVPSARHYHTAVWTGSKMIVWGAAIPNTGGQYDPAGDSWTVTTVTGTPTERDQHTAVWTGSKMIVWGGTPDGINYVNTGGSYGFLSLYVKN
jgi:N-acetylneuraminic acid mutarotase